MIYEFPVIPRPPAFVHVDLDGLWTLADCYGFPQGESFERDPIYEKALPRMLQLFERLGLKATFFLIGRDLEHPAKREAAREIVRQGHEVANHTYHHPFGLEAMSPEEIREEIGRAQTAIADVTGVVPTGFRSPGYDAGPRVLKILCEMGFLYDGSFLPTRWGPLLRFSARRLRRRVSRGLQRSAEEGEPATEPLPPAPEAGGQYGPGSGGPWGLAPRYFRPSPGRRPLARFPLAVSPVFRLPLHASLGMLLGRSSVASGLKGLARRKWPITYLLHGIDLAAPEEFTDFLPPELAGSRVFNIPLGDREAFLNEVLGELQHRAEPMLTGCYLKRTGEEGADEARMAAHGVAGTV